MTIETLPYTYTSLAEIERIFSQDGVELKIDPSDPTFTDVVNDAINEATDTINLYVGNLYNAQQLANNLLVRKWAGYYACHFISMLHGDPAQFSHRVEYLESKLEQVQNGKLQLPRLGLTSDYTPSVINQVVDDRYRINKLREEESISRGGPTADVDADSMNPGYPI